MGDPHDPQAPVAPPGRRIPARLGTSVGVVLLLIAIVGLQHTLPDHDRMYRPIATHGRVGEVVRTPDFRIQVDKVELARTVTQPAGAIGDGDDAPATTDGIWVIVWARAAAEREPSAFDRLTGLQLGTGDGHRYAPTSLGELAGAVLEPRLWKYGPIVFEVPPSRLPGAELLASLDGRPLSAQVNIPLGLAEVEVRRLVRDAPRQYQLTAVRYA